MTNPLADIDRDPATTRPDYSVALPPSRQIVEYALAAEALGYRRVWLFDSPALYGDVWMALGRVAEATERIGLATGVAIPSLRHPMVTASAIATIEDLSPGRLIAAFGTGFTGRKTMGQKPMPWTQLATYVRQLRGLLAGEVVDIDGAACRMLHSPGWGAARPIATPIWVAPGGPKGLPWPVSWPTGSSSLAPYPSRTVGGTPAALLVFGTVVRPGEDHLSPRLIEAAGPCFATSFHGAWEYFPGCPRQPARRHGVAGRRWRRPAPSVNATLPFTRVISPT